MVQKRFSGFLAAVVFGILVLGGQPSGAQAGFEFQFGLPNPFGSPMPCFGCQMTGRCAYCQGTGESSLGPCTVCSRTGRCTMCRGLGQIMLPPQGSGLSAPSLGDSTAIPTREEATCGVCRGTGRCIACRGTRHGLHYGIACDGPCCGGCSGTGICTTCAGRGRR